MLSHNEARTFYDRFGKRQDSQGFYEDRPVADMIAHGDFARARTTYEFGCGTGKFAESLLDNHLAADSKYHGVDISSTMIGLARKRTGRFGDRVRIVQTEGSPSIDLIDGSVDRVVSNYVLDLLSEEEIRAFLAEAHRILTPGGWLCLVSLTHGVTLTSRAIMGVWKRVHARWPGRVGGCRPISLCDFLPEEAWEILHRNVIVSFGIPSEVVVASPKCAGTPLRRGA